MNAKSDALYYNNQTTIIEYFILHKLCAILSTFLGLRCCRRFIATLDMVYLN